MKQVLAIVAAAVVGSALGAGGGALLGVAGALLALWVGQRLQQLADRVELLERQLAQRAAATAPASPPPASSATALEAGVRRVDAVDGPPSPAMPIPAARPQRATWATSDPTAAAAPDDARAAVPDGAGAARPEGPPAAAGPALVAALRDWFTGGNTLVRVGIVVLFCGVAFLLRYVAERTELPIEFRLAGVALGAIAMLVLGWWLRVRRPGYALAIQGGAIGILYLTVFVALRLYGVLTPAAAFPLLVLVTAFATMLAVLQGSQSFALLAIAGGFAAPLLAASGQGDHVTLFGYYLVLTAGIVGIAWFKAWRALMLLGFVATFLVGSAWGGLRYRAELFGSTEPFLVAFFLAYVAVAVLFALRQPPDLKGYVDGTLVFGPPVAAFALQSAMLHEQPYRLAFSALAVGGLYVALAVLLWRRRGATLRLLVESFLALGIAFLTLAIPLAIDGHWSAATWALEGAALVWVGCRQQRLLPRTSGVLLQFAAGLMFWRGLDLPAASLPLLNSAWLGGAMVAAAALFSATLLRRAAAGLASWERPVAAVLSAWGLGWWILAGLAEIDRRLPTGEALAATLVFAAGTAWAGSALHRRHATPLAQWPAGWLAPVLGLLALVQVGRVAHPLAAGGVLAWPIALGVLFWLLRRHADDPLELDDRLRVATGIEAGAASRGGPEARGDGAAADAGGFEPVVGAALHTLAAWLVVALVAVESSWQAARVVGDRTDWVEVARMLPAWFALLALPSRVARVDWPFARHATTYLLCAGGGLAAWLAMWLLAMQLRSGGDAAPLPFVPLLNPLDVACGLAVLALLRHGTALRSQARLAAAVDARFVAGLCAALAFAWLNGALLRALHHLAGVPYELDALLRSTLTQVALSIFWAVLALGAMLFATRRANRLAWLAGAGLLAIVVAKLFLVDLSRVGSVERIVSFVVVGLLMLVIGYFSPLPPARAAAQSADATGRRAAGESA